MGVATCPSQERAPLYAYACLLPIGAAPYERSSATRLAFDSHAWCAAQADRDFIDILARMRSGACSSEDLRELEARCSGSLDLSDGILPTMVRRCTPAVLQNLGHLIGPIPMCLWGGSRRRRGGTDCKGTPSSGASSSWPKDLTASVSAQHMMRRPCKMKWKIRASAVKASAMPIAAGCNASSGALNPGMRAAVHAL